VEVWAAANLVIVVSQHIRRTAQRFQPGFAVDQGKPAEILAVQEQQIKQEEDQRSPARIGRVLDQVECRPAIRQHPAKFAVKVGILRRQSALALAMAGYLCVQSLPRRVRSCTLPASSSSRDRADSGRINTRWVCPECGSWVASPPRDGVSRVRAGTLDDTSWLRPTRHIWTRSKQPWITFAEGDQIFEAPLAAFWERMAVNLR
jgi:hypothetical protein